MKKATTKIIFIILVALCGLISYTKVYATTDIEEISLEILDKDNNCLTIMPPMSGGINGYIDSSLNYDDCKYELFLPLDTYEETITINGLGTFHKDSESYIANITDTSILSTGEFKTIDFELNNIKTQKNDKFRVYLLCFKNKFGTNANLSVNGNQFIENGKILLEDTDPTKEYIVYDRVYNILRTYGLDSKSIKFENMGKDFIIEKNYDDSEGNHICEQYNPYTEVKLMGKGNVISQDDMMVVENVTTGDIYNKVIKALKDICKNEQIYDISIEKDRIKKQPNGKVKISLPINNSSDLSNLIVYRITEEGEKIEYNVTVETINNKKYATFETDHFSTYVLAEKVENVQEENEKTTEENKEETQEKQKEHILDNEPKTGIESKSILVIIMIVISLKGLIICEKRSIE